MAEKKFCTNCGKQLKKGETCDCKKESKKVSSSVDFATLAKDLWEDLINMFKKPATTVNEKVKESSLTAALIVLAIISITVGVLVMAITKQTLAVTVGSLIKGVEIPYFKLFIYGTLLTFAGSFIPVLVSFATAKIVKNDKFDFKASLALYSYSYYPLTGAFLAYSLILLANVELLTTIGTIALACVAIFTAVTYIKGFLDEVEIDKNKVAYVVALMLVATAILTSLASKIVTESMTKDITSSVSTKTSSGLNSLLK